MCACKQHTESFDNRLHLSLTLGWLLIHRKFLVLPPDRLVVSTLWGRCGMVRSGVHSCLFFTRCYLWMFLYSRQVNFQWQQQEICKLKKKTPFTCTLGRLSLSSVVCYDDIFSETKWSLKPQTMQSNVKTTTHRKGRKINYLLEDVSLNGNFVTCTNQYNAFQSPGGVTDCQGTLVDWLTKNY